MNNEIAPTNPFDKRNPIYKEKSAEQQDPYDIKLKQEKNTIIVSWSEIKLSGISWYIVYRKADKSETYDEDRKGRCKNSNLKGCKTGRWRKLFV